MRRTTYLEIMLTASVFLLLSVYPAGGKVVYVDADANGLNNGANWTDAYYYLQDGLMVASAGDEIWVAQGTYKPDDFVLSDRPNLGRKETFQLKNGVAVKGGYAGFGEPDPNARDIEAYETILSGDLDGNDVEVNDPCDLPTEPTRAENSYHVVTSCENDATAVLCGFTITGGNADGSYPNYNAGGMYNDNSDPTVSHCTFLSNSANNFGGGMCNFRCSGPTLNNCTFSSNSAYRGGGMYGGAHNVLHCRFIGNWAEEGGGINTEGPCGGMEIVHCTFSGNAAIDGGGMVNFDTSLVTLNNCTFVDNAASGSGGGLYNSEANPSLTDCTLSGNVAVEGNGGGIYSDDGSNPTVTNCNIIGNMARYSGGGICCLGSSPMVTNCTISQNTVGSEDIYVGEISPPPPQPRVGGGIFCYRSNPIITNCVINNNRGMSPYADSSGGGIYCSYSNPTINNCTIGYNRVESGGGGIWCHYSSPTITNCTFSRNLADVGGGICNGLGSNATLGNCILWENRPQQIVQFDHAVTVIYSDVLGGWPGQGNIDAEPHFADPCNDDYHLKSQAGRWEPSTKMWVQDDVTSPCIDAGDLMSPIGLEPFPNGGIVNMGSYGGTVEASKSYFGEPVCETIVAGDVNGDCNVNFLDFRLMALHWLEDNTLLPSTE